MREKQYTPFDKFMMLVHLFNGIVLLLIGLFGWKGLIPAIGSYMEAKINHDASQPDFRAVYVDPCSQCYQSPEFVGRMRKGVDGIWKKEGGK